ncbi:MAG: hypothetical protein KAT37_01340 [Candidatus Aenigmarchaeota archaeon]|nr:hypothetical protein [Candidatus Aenigmarchaeota archaeon]
MNKHAYILAMVLIVFISGCVEGESTFSIFGLDIGPGDPLYTTSENLRIETEVIPSEIYEGKSTTLFFDIYNTGNTTLKSINAEITDLGGFTASESSKFIDELEEGEIESWSWKLDSGHTEVHSNINQVLRYKLSYNSNSYAMYDIVAMSEDEYTRLEREGKLDEEINLFYYKTKSPVEIDLSISKDQPLFEGLELYLYVTLSDMGTGTVKQINARDLVIYYPSDIITYQESSDLSNPEEGKLLLRYDTKFYNKKTKKLTCKFKVNDVNIRDIRQFKVNANYIYDYYKTINIKVKPK